MVFEVPSNLIVIALSYKPNEFTWGWQHLTKEEETLAGVYLKADAARLVTKFPL